MPCPLGVRIRSNTSNPPGDGASRCVEHHDHGRFFHPASDLRVGDRRHHGAGGVDLLFPAAGLAVSRHHAAAGRRQRRLSRRQRAGRRRHRHDAARTADQRRRGHDLHVVVELQRWLVEHHHHLRCRLSAEHRGRRRPEPRLAGGVLAAGDRQSGRRDDQEAEPELRPDRQSHLAGQFGRSGGAEQLRLSADRRSAEAPAGRRRRADLRRAALFDASLARSRQARQSRHHRRRRAERYCRAERAGCRRQDRPVARACRHAFEMQVNAPAA